MKKQRREAKLGPTGALSLAGLGPNPIQFSDWERGVLTSILNEAFQDEKLSDIAETIFAKLSSGKTLNLSSIETVLLRLGVLQLLLSTPVESFVPSAGNDGVVQITSDTIGLLIKLETKL